MHRSPISSAGPCRPLLLLIALVTAGCQQPDLASRMHHRPNGGGPDTVLGLQREIFMNSEWQNRPLSQLLAAMGKPRLLLNIPGGGNPPGFVAIYGIDHASGCVDAFAMLYGPDPTIRVYHCR